jgi:hypothetical protein
VAPVVLVTTNPFATTGAIEMGWRTVVSGCNQSSLPVLAASANAATGVLP